MDADTTSPEVYARCLRDLAAVNFFTLTHRPILNWLTQATKALPPGTPVTILDIACGQGDLLRAIHRWAARRGLAVTLEGLDLNPASAYEATAVTPPEMAITYRTGNVFDYDPTELPQLIVTSQFAHHLTDPEVEKFLQWLDRHATRGWFIADLHRHAVAYYGFPILARLAGWHRIVRQDGQISIARGFRREELKQRLMQVGIAADIGWSVPFRYGVGRLK